MSRDISPKGNRAQRAGGISSPAVAVLILLLILPTYAASRFYPRIDWPVLVGAPLLVSVIAFFIYRDDKRRAQTGDWRIPESTLHLVELIGGWPGAFLAQRMFRHKTSKTSFQVVFWIIVLAHEFLAFDSLAGWRLSKNAWHLIKGYNI